MHIDLLTSEPIRPRAERVVDSFGVLNELSPEHLPVERVARFPVVNVDHGMIEREPIHEHRLPLGSRPRTRKCRSVLPSGLVEVMFGTRVVCAAVERRSVDLGASRAMGSAWTALQAGGFRPDRGTW